MKILGGLICAFLIMGGYAQGNNNNDNAKQFQERMAALNERIYDFEAKIANIPVGDISNNIPEKYRNMTVKQYLEKPALQNEMGIVKSEVINKFGEKDKSWVMFFKDCTQEKLYFKQGAGVLIDKSDLSMERKEFCLNLYRPGSNDIKKFIQEQYNNFYPIIYSELEKIALACKNAPVRLQAISLEVNLVLGCTVTFEINWDAIKEKNEER